MKVVFIITEFNFKASLPLTEIKTAQKWSPWKLDQVTGGGRYRWK